MPRKLYNIELVKEMFEAKGFILLEEQYINTSTPMKYKCTCGEPSTVTFSNLKIGKGTKCRKCGNKLAAEIRK